jgi:hypothetical protein
MNRSKALSLTLAGLATAWLLLWANMGFTSPILNATWLLLGLIGAFAAIWLAWNPRSQSFHEQDRSIDHTFTEL